MPDLVRIDVHSIAQGGLFRGRGSFATQLMRNLADDIEEDSAEWAHGQITRIYRARFRHPTGYYESRVHVSNTSSGVEIGDGGQAGPVYGPWLEGVGSRNATTRFKGYHAFRIVTSMLEQRIEVIGDRLLWRVARRL